jgi:hypothetical protein
MRALVAALTLVLLALPVLPAAPARAQLSAGPGKTSLQNGAPKAEQKPKVDDKAYSNALGNLPDKKYDPWKGVR